MDKVLECVIESDARISNTRTQLDIRADVDRFSKLEQGVQLLGEASALVRREGMIVQDNACPAGISAELVVSANSSPRTLPS